MRSWFLQDDMDFEILFMVSFNITRLRFFRFDLNKLERCMHNLSHIISFKAAFTFLMIICKNS